MIAHSALYAGQVMHQRLRPRRHRLTYRLYMVLLDLDELDTAAARLRLFSRGRFNLFSFHDADHGAGTAEPLRAQVERHLQAAGLSIAGGAIRLLTMPRVLGFAFNPISVYFCYRRDGSLAATLYEVNNTFGQRHSYLLPVEPGAGPAIRQTVPKHFHVSPFMGMAMDYAFRVVPPAQALGIAITGSDDGGTLITAVLSAKRRELTDAALVRAFCTMPLVTLKVVAGIGWEALKLWLKGVPWRHRPAPPAKPITIIAPTERPRMYLDLDRTGRTTAPLRPGFSLRNRVIRSALRAVRKGRLTIVMPGGARIEHSGAEPGFTATIALGNMRALKRIVTGGDLGFAEGFIAGDWTTPDLVALIGLFADNVTALQKTMDGFAPVRLVNRLRHMLRSNSRSGSRRNIAFHYDLGNDFYRLWLDDSMTYSSACSVAPGQTLEAAQAARLDRIAQLLDLRGGETVLEIGCGWGALAAHLAPRCASVTGITLSREQWSHARSRCSDAGLVNVDLRLQDYRDVATSFHRIVSIEMLEAVGEAWWPTYFDRLRSCLAPGGTAVLQVITMREDRFASYRSGSDFIQRYIFPGGLLPTPSIIAEQAERAGLVVQSVDRFAAGYAATLAEWRRRFLAAETQVAALGFDAEFRRLWEYYLCYCEAGFRSGTIDVGLYVLKG